MHISELLYRFYYHQIDNLVYRLYNLTYEEVKVIEPGLAMDKAEYEGSGVGGEYINGYR
ncbi:MAG: hypothetical protein LBE13_01575 [Bacteroidales bacterium]|jgi:hypothetical protein|nr:hypothetical protein [Bacteroidales bacterium]